MSVEENNRVLSELEAQVEATPDIEASLALSEFAGAFACQNHTGRFVSIPIERRLRQIGEGLTQDWVRSSPGTVVHVMTTALTVGGHTRVIERWIRARRSERHSVVLVDQGTEPIPVGLAQAVTVSGGTITSLRGTRVGRLTELARLCSGFELVALHIHPHDAVSVAAFSNPRFPRPVVFYNHADHVFWLGVGAVDLLLEMSDVGARLSRTRRCGPPAVIVPVPVSPLATEQARSAIELREELGLPSDAFVVLSIGSSYKFEPFEELDYFAFAKAVLRRSERTHFLIIGPSPVEGRWLELIQEGRGRVHVLGPIPHVSLGEYIRLADLCVDPFPVGGGTTVLELILCGVPTLSVDNGLTQYDSYLPLRVPAGSIVEAVLRAERGAPPEMAAVRESVIGAHCDPAWSERLASTLRVLPRAHSPISHFALNDLRTDYDMRLARLQRRRGLIVPVQQLAALPLLERLHCLRILAPACNPMEFARALVAADARILKGARHVRRLYRRWKLGSSRTESGI